MRLFQALTTPWSNTSTTTITCSVVLIGCAVSIYYSIKQWTGSPSKVPPIKKKKKFKEPLWAKRKAKELEPPKMSKEELQELNRIKPPDMWNTVIFFPDMVPSRPDAPIKQLIQYFLEARTSICLCMYLCSYVVLSDVIQDMYKKKGIVVLVISENDTWTAHNNFGLKCLEKVGIPVRLNTNGLMMHNKFAIIDDEAVLTGSLNWTRQGVMSNHENVLVTTDPRIVPKYVQEFAKLWNICKSTSDLDG